MPTLCLVILYVDNPRASADFYRDLLGLSPAELSDTFARFVLPSGLNLGLWSRHTVEPAASAAGGGGEVAFMAEDIDAVHASWAARGLVMAQVPCDMDFGRTFVALDRDGHRLRVFAPAEPL